MRRTMVVGAAILALLAVIGIGVAAYSAGVDEGISREVAQSGNADQVVRVVGHGWGYGPGFGFPFGLILFPLFLIGIVLLVRGAFARGRWGGPPRWWGPGGPGGPGGYGPPGSWGGPGSRVSTWWIPPSATATTWPSPSSVAPSATSVTTA